MGRADARSAEIDGPDGIAQVFQVSAYSSEPQTLNRARNDLPIAFCNSVLVTYVTQPNQASSIRLSTASPQFPIAAFIPKQTIRMFAYV